VKLASIDFLPLKLIVAYVSLGVFLSIYGPVEYDGYDFFPVAVYMLAFLMLFSLAYLLAFHGSESVVSGDDICKARLLRVLFWVKVCILITFLVQLATLLAGVADGSLNLSLTGMGEAYFDAYADYERGTGDVSTQFLIQTLVYVPYLVTLILGVFYFKDLPFTYKCLVMAVYVLVFLLETVGHGKQKQFGDMLVFFALAQVLKVNLLNSRTRAKVMRRMFFIGVAGVMGLLFILSLRYTAIDVSISNVNAVSHELIAYSEDHLVFNIFGDAIGFPMAVFFGYLSQGYYGLSLAMQQPFEWTYFVGNSYSLTVLLNRYLDIPVDFHDTYPYRASLVTAWDDTKWSTVFAWFAGDFTFIGTLIFFMLVAYLYAKVWREAYRYSNPISIVLFAILTIALLYIPANNQLLHTPGSVIALFFFVGLWFILHKRYNFLRPPSEN